MRCEAAAAGAAQLEAGEAKPKGAAELEAAAAAEDRMTGRGDRVKAPLATRFLAMAIMMDMQRKTSRTANRTNVPPLVVFCF